VHYLLYNPTPEHFVIEGPTEVTAGDTIVYRINTSPNVSFFWDIENGEQVSYGISDTIAIWWHLSETGTGKITSLGYYPVTFCYTTEYLDVIINPAGVEEHAINEVYVYPNPANSALYIHNFKQGYITTIYNSSGLKVLQANQENIDVSRLEPGLYFVQIIDKKADIITVEKVIVN
jgi:hypothetical protein